jgi:hypothetical protein
MGRLSHHRECEQDSEDVTDEVNAVAQPRVTEMRSLQWASAVGNQAVQRVARRAIAREAAEEEVEEGTPEAQAEEGTPQGQAGEGAAAAAEPAAPEGFAPEEAAGLAAMDELPEDALPE